jgi:hypothetical protein
MLADPRLREAERVEPAQLREVHAIPSSSGRSGGCEGIMNAPSLTGSKLGGPRALHETRLYLLP